jgi:hypothetical protein
MQYQTSGTNGTDAYSHAASFRGKKTEPISVGGKHRGQFKNEGYLLYRLE